MDEGFAIKDRKQLLMWWKYVAFENGISPSEFNNCKLSDIKEVVSLKNAMGAKELRNRKVRDMINRVRFK